MHEKGRHGAMGPRWCGIPIPTCILYADLNEFYFKHVRQCPPLFSFSSSSSPSAPKPKAKRGGSRKAFEPTFKYVGLAASFVKVVQGGSAMT